MAILCDVNHSHWFFKFSCWSCMVAYKCRQRDHTDCSSKLNSYLTVAWRCSLTSAA